MNHNKIKRINTKSDVFQMIMAIKLNRKKRNEFNEIFVEGIESIKQALSSNNVEMRKIIFHDFNSLSNWSKNLINKSIFKEIIQLDKRLYNELSDKNEPSEIMITLKYNKIRLKDIKLGGKRFIVIFDRPSDQGNLGSLIRSANAFDVDLFITHGHGVDLFESKVIRSSLGTVFHTKIVHEESFKVLEEWLNKQKKENGLTVIGTDSTGDLSLNKIELKLPIALIIGNEAKGMSVALKGITDKIIKIPISGEVNSLNVACAGSIILWSIYKNMIP